MKHSYNVTCPCARCRKESARRLEQANRTDRKARTMPEVMTDWHGSRNARRRRIAAEYWDDFESGRPMSDDDR